MGVFAFWESLNGDDSGSQSVAISHLKHIGFYTGITKELQIISSAARSATKISSNLAFFDVRTVHATAKIRPGELKTALANNLKGYTGEIAAFLITSRFHRCKTSISLFQSFSVASICTAMT